MPVPSRRVGTSRPADHEPSPRRVTRRIALTPPAPFGAERPVAGEVAEAVGDQPAAVPLEPAEDMRAVADDEVGAGVDDRVGERAQIAAVLAQVRLGAVRDVAAVVALGARMHRHDDDVRPSGRPAARARPLLSGSSTPPFSPAYENPRTDTRTGCLRTRVARPGSPVCARLAPSSAATVSASPVPP